jgi:predicted MFS family arabinose efflux permease
MRYATPLSATVDVRAGDYDALAAAALIGLGLGIMLTPSVNVVQSAFPEDQQGEISGLSRSVSNLGSSLGTAIAGTILVSDLAAGNRSYALAMASLAVIGLIGTSRAGIKELASAAEPNRMRHGGPSGGLSGPIGPIGPFTV